ncbi:hypothetical protein F4212_04055 [Candidatus Poribacteria bacterium]|nr:hypothetical protein [Candidatus Poribacteria bacterium]
MQNATTQKSGECQKGIHTVDLAFIHVLREIRDSDKTHAKYFTHPLVLLLIENGVHSDRITELVVLGFNKPSLNIDGNYIYRLL